MQKANIGEYNVHYRMDTFNINQGDPIPCIIEEWKDSKTNKLHKSFGAAVTVYETNTNSVLMKAYYEQGKLHRTGGKPARIITQGDYIGKFWYENGLGHRENAPAVLEKDEFGLFQEEWLLNGKRHRPDGPAFIFINEDVVEYEQWSLDGEYHRDGDEPAFIVRDIKTGIATEQSWYRHGQLFRENNKPCVVKTHWKTGDILEEKYVYPKPEDNHLGL